MLQEQFSSFIEKKNLIPAGHKTLLAVSGGMDSLVMTHLFSLTGREFGIAHCNFKLRGKDSDNDEVFVKKIAEKFSVPFFSTAFDTIEQSHTTGDSVQMTARQLRYEWLEKIRKDNNYNFVATGHHHDDNIETLFINIVRGAGIRGVQGIPLKNQNIIRPLLFAARSEIEQFAKDHNIKYHEDASNKENKYARNKIRNQVIPVFEEINPNFRDSINRFFENISLPYECYSNHIEQIKKDLVISDGNKYIISIYKLQQLHYPATLLLEILKPFGFNVATVSDIVASFKKQPGKVFYGHGYSLVKDRDCLILFPETDNNNREVVYVDDKQDEVNLQNIKLEITKLEVTKDFLLSTNKKLAYLDYDKLQFPLKIRRWQKGDAFKPFGMDGNKKVSDFLIDKKISVDKKEAVYVLCSGENIAWVVGYRIDERFKIEKNSKRCYCVRMI